METPNRKPHEYSRSMKAPYSHGPYVPMVFPAIFLGFLFWRSHQGPFIPGLEEKVRIEIYV